MTIAALDVRGCIVALKMEDGSGLMRPDIAAGKAWGALGMGFGTRNLAGRAQSLPQFFGALADLADGRVLPVPGGVLEGTAQPTQPTFAFRDSSFWAQGIHFGLELRDSPPP